MSRCGIRWSRCGAKCAAGFVSRISIGCFCPALSLVSVFAAGAYHHSVGDSHSLAPRRLSLLLALEVTILERASED